MASIFGSSKRKRSDLDKENNNNNKSGNIFARRTVEEETPSAESNSTTSTVTTLLKRQKKEDGKLRDQARTSLNRAAKLKNIMHYNKLILDMGNTRGLYGYAVQAFNDLIDNKLTPNLFTFANIMNACARASEVEACRNYFNDMEKYDLKPDEIIYTILMKTYCTAGQVKEAVKILNEMDENGVEPNIRTFQTLVRECMHANNLKLAEKVIGRMQEQGLKMTATIMEHLCKIYILRLDIPNALDYLTRLQDLLLQNEENDQVFNSELLPVSVASCAAGIANACFVLNDMKTGKRILSQARSAIEIVRERSGKNDWWKAKDKRKKKFRVADNQEDSDSDSDEEKKKRQAFERSKDFTSNQFKNLRESEVEMEIKRLESYLRQVAHVQHTTVPELVRDDAISSCQFKANGLLKRGLSESHRVYNIMSYHEHSDPETIKTAEKQNGSLPLDWERIFRNQNDICIEVCSGQGEWVCDRAARNKDINWVAIEMSPERVYQIYTRAQLMHLNNLVIVCGEATFCLTNCFNKASVAQLYVNYPEPPVWGRWIFRLLKEDFFSAAFRCLVKSRKVKKGTDEDEFEDHEGSCGNGFLTIVTDDLGYVWTLDREMNGNGKSAHLFKSILPDGEFFTTNMPTKYGSSYYSRFWDNGSKSQRYYFKLGKVKPAK